MLSYVATILQILLRKYMTCIITYIDTGFYTPMFSKWGANGNDYRMYRFYSSFHLFSATSLLKRKYIVVGFYKPCDPCSENFSWSQMSWHMWHNLTWAPWALRTAGSNLIFSHHVIMNSDLIVIRNSWIMEINKKILVSISGYFNCPDYLKTHW